jgi:hypothetical protein
MIEVRVAANDRLFKQGFYLAESAAMEAAQRIEDTSDASLRSGSVAWINSQATLISDIEASGWSGSGTSISSIDTNTRYGAVGQGVAAGSSLGMGGSNLRSFAVFGRFGSPRGRCLVEAGYKKRF